MYQISQVKASNDFVLERDKEIPKNYKKTVAELRIIYILLIQIVAQLAGRNIE